MADAHAPGEGPNSTRDRLDHSLHDIVQTEEKAMVNSWVCVMEVIDENGQTQLWSMSSAGLPVWTQRGMLDFRKEMLAVEPIPEEDLD